MIYQITTTIRDDEIVISSSSLPAVAFPRSLPDLAKTVSVIHDSFFKNGLSVTKPSLMVGENDAKKSSVHIDTQE